MTDSSRNVFPGSSIEEIELSILMPCLNEAETLEACIRKALSYLDRSKIRGEVIVADNGSTDGSQAIATRSGARIVQVPDKGYGSALRGGISAAIGSFVIMGDADDSYDFANLDEFVSALRGGADLVMGNRFLGGIAPGAMPFHHRYLGNPVLSALGNLFFPSKAKDFHCGLRGFKKDSILSLQLNTTGMEFASEMVVKASLHGLQIEEVPTTLSPDGRSRAPHLRSWRDGWRHLRFLLVYSPRWLFLYPGITLVILGFVIMLALIPAPLKLGNVTLDTNTMLYGGILVILGLESVTFSVFTQIFGMNAGLLPINSQLRGLVNRLTLERGLLLGASFVLIGVIGTVLSLATWSYADFGPLNASRIARLTVPSVTALASGLQIILSSFFISILQIGRAGLQPFNKLKY